MERELPDYIKRLQAVIAAEPAKQAEYRAHMDRQFFELKFHICIAYELMRRRIERLERNAQISKDTYLRDYNPN